MILLHGGFSVEMLSAIGAMFVVGVLIVVYLHRLVKRTDFYQTAYLQMSAFNKVIFYLLFLISSIILAYFASFLFVMFLALLSGLTNTFIRWIGF